MKAFIFTVNEICIEFLIAATYQVSFLLLIYHLLLLLTFFYDIH